MATVLGFAILKLLNRLPIQFTPWQSLVSFITPIVAKICFFMVFLLPVANSLFLPTGHSPDTLPKYLSLVILKPQNLFSMPTNAFPGIVLIVIVSIVLMFWGGMKLDRKRNFILALSGLLLFTLSPTIASIFGGDFRFRFNIGIFSVGYYMAWIGLLLVVLNNFLARYLKPAPALNYNPSGFYSLVPAVLAVGIASKLGAVDLYALGQGFIDSIVFGYTHHAVAAVVSGAVAAVGSAVIVSGVDSAGGYGGSQTSYLPELSTDPGDEPGTIVQRHPNGTVTKRAPDGTVGTLSPDGTQYIESPNGGRAVYYPDGSANIWDPIEGSEIHHPNGDFERITADGTRSTITNNEDGSMDIVSGWGGSLHIPEDGFPEGSITAANGDVIALNGDGSGTYQTQYGTINIDKDGNLSGSITDEGGNSLTVKPDGSIDGVTAAGDKLTVDADGLRAKFADGSFFNTDAEGNLTDCHITDDKGVTYDLKTNKNGTVQIKDSTGNSGTFKPDGTGEIKGSDGSVLKQDADGSATYVSPEGTAWSANVDGTSSVVDAQGNRLALVQDGSVTVKNVNGETTSYTAEQVNQMKAQEVR
jgi:hypothetical protein